MWHHFIPDLLHSFSRSPSSISCKQQFSQPLWSDISVDSSALWQEGSLSDVCFAVSGVYGSWPKRSRNLALASAQKVLPSLAQHLCEPQERLERGNWGCPSPTWCLYFAFSLTLAACVLPIILQCWKVVGHMVPQTTWSQESETPWGIVMRTLAFSWWESVIPVGLFQKYYFIFLKL